MSDLYMSASPADLFVSIRGFQYAFHEAVGDLVDNAVDADASRVVVEASKEFIIIADDGTGMDKETLQKAITPWKSGHKSSKERENKRGKFGIGMKSAGFALGDLIEIHTKMKGKEFHFFVLDPEEISKKTGEKERFQSKNEITDLWKQYCKESGTVIRIRKVNHRKVTDPNIESLKNKMGVMYFKLIESGLLTVLVNHARVEPIHPLLPDLRKGSPGNYYMDLGDESFKLKTDGGKATIKLKAVHIGRGNHWADSDKKKYRYFLKKSGAGDTEKGLLKLDDQGIYTLRNGRLITLGGWHGLASTNTLLHHNSACRILLEFDEVGDELMGLDHTKTKLEMVDDVRAALGQFVKDAVRRSEDLFRKEGQVVKKKKQHSAAAEDLRSRPLAKPESAKRIYELESKRKSLNDEYDRQQESLDKELTDEVSKQADLAEIKEKLPYNNLWDLKVNKNGEVTLLLNEQHPGYAALFLEDDDEKIRRNLNLLFYTLAHYEAQIPELVAELKPAVREELVKQFRAFRRYVSKHFTEF